METKEMHGIRHYLDDVAKDLAQRFNPANVGGPLGLTGNIQEECALMPFVLVASNTGDYFGLDQSGYNKVIELLSGHSETRTEMVFAQSFLKRGAGLKDLVEKGHLREVDHQETKVYFPSEKMIRSATSPY